MPLPIVLAHRLARRLAEVRKDGTLDYLRPDGKTQVTVRYELDEHGHRTPVEIERVLISTQHRDGVDAESTIKPDLIEHVIEPILKGDHAHLLDDARMAGRDFVYVNPTGSFVTGGPMGDTGLTGRKIVVDTYGGAAPHGGGAFSGKDPTKVDRSAAYAARYVAKNVVAAGLAHRCQVQVAYAIGVAQPVSINVECFGTAVDPRGAHRGAHPRALRPASGRDRRDLDLRRPIYAATAAYGHFGRSDLDLSWERTDRADALRAGSGPHARDGRSALAMTVTVVGSVAFDSLETPFGRRERILGGAATHFSLAASMFTDVRVVGVVGDDFGYRRARALPLQGHRHDRPRARSRRAVLLLEGPLRQRHAGRRDARDAAQRVRRLRAEALGGRALVRDGVPREHPARPAARRARAVRRAR